MSMNSLAHAFLRVAIFQGLKPLQMTEIAKHADRIVFQPGQVIIEDGQPGDTAYLIVTGEAVREPRPSDETPTATIIPVGSLIAEMMMLVDSVHTSTIVAHNEVRALGINRHTMRDLMLADPEIAEHFVAKITARLSELATVLRKIDQTLKPADAELHGRHNIQTASSGSDGRSSANDHPKVHLENRAAIH